MDLLAKLAATAERHARMKALGGDAVGVVNEKILSPTRAIIDGRETILAGTNNYMGITFDAECIAAGQKALAEYRHRHHRLAHRQRLLALHKELETEFARFLDRKHCIVFTTGYQANLGMMSGLAGPRDTIYLDADSHSSIYDGCTLSGAKLVRFRHNDAADLDKRLTRGEGDEGGKLVVLEGIYSMMGDRAPLADFVEVKKKHGFQLLVDEAHSFGVLGPHGRGLADEAGLEKDVDFVVGTFSKSVGAIGGFGAGDHPYFEYLRYRDAALHVHRIVLACLRSPPRSRRSASLPPSRSAARSWPRTRHGCSTASRRWASSSAATRRAPSWRCAARTSPRPSPCGTRC